MRLKVKLERMSDMSIKNNKIDEIVSHPVGNVDEVEIEKIDILTDASISQAQERENDFLRSRLHDLMGLKVVPPNDEVLVGEVAQRMTRLMKLEDDMDMIAQAFNCPKSEVIANTIENVKIYEKMEKAEKELEKERENFLRELKNLDEENQRLFAAVDSLRGQIEAQTDAIERVREENKRIGFWDRLFGVKDDNGGEDE